MNDPSPPHPPDQPGEAPSTPTQPPRRSLQFGLGTLMLALTVTAAVGAPLAYFGRAMRGDRGAHFVFILLCIALPTLFLVAVSLLRAGLDWWLRLRQKR